LYATLVFERTLRVGIARAVAVVDGVGIDNRRNGAFLAGELRLDAAPGAAIFCDRDPALDLDA
jgi:hypothetical protein